MIHPHTRLKFVSDEVGHGVIATRKIPRGTVTWAFDWLDREIQPHLVEAMPDAFRDNLLTYCFRNRQGNFVLCWDHTRYMNHSFQANCLLTAYNFEVAIRDIEPGEQLTNDYGHLNILEPFTPEDEGGHRKTVYPDDILRLHSEWDQELLQAFQALAAVDQPLRPLLSAETWRHCLAVAENRETMTSILACYNGHAAAK